MNKKHKIEKSIMMFFLRYFGKRLGRDIVYKVTLWHGDRYLFFYATDVEKWVWGDKCKK